MLNVVENNTYTIVDFANGRAMALPCLHMAPPVSERGEKEKVTIKRRHGGGRRVGAAMVAMEVCLCSGFSKD